jgi:putative tryptophan/tyrosine transport system substrate-binding protein
MKRRHFITLVGGAAAAVWPLAALAQQRSSPPAQIGFLPMGSPSNSADLSLVEAFRKGVNDGGLLEGRDVIVDVAWVGSEGEYTKNIIELIRRGTAILATAGSSASSVAKRQTSTIPIVFVNVGNPIGIGLVESFPRPGGNATGFSDAVADLSGKFVDLAIELQGQRAPIDYLWHTGWEDGRNRYQLTEKAAQAAGVTLRSRPLTDIDDLEPQLAAMKSDGATVLIIQPGPFAHRYRKQIFKSATNAGYATIYGIALAAHDGALIGYGPI